MADVIELEVEADENGELHLSKEQLGGAEPKARFKVRVEPQTPTTERGPKWAGMTPEERARKFEAWARSHKDGPGLSDWAVSRDSIYD